MPGLTGERHPIAIQRTDGPLSPEEHFLDTDPKDIGRGAGGGGGGGSSRSVGSSQGRRGPLHHGVMRATRVSWDHGGLPHKQLL